MFYEEWTINMKYDYDFLVITYYSGWAKRAIKGACRPNHTIIIITNITNTATTTNLHSLTKGMHSSTKLLFVFSEFMYSIDFGEILRDPFDE